jgi:hypothetical protein
MSSLPQRRLKDAICRLVANSSAEVGEFVLYATLPVTCDRAYLRFTDIIGKMNRSIFGSRGSHLRARVFTPVVVFRHTPRTLLFSRIEGCIKNRLTDSQPAAKEQCVTGKHLAPDRESEVPPPSWTQLDTESCPTPLPHARALGKGGRAAARTLRLGARQTLRSRVGSSR